MKPYSLIAPDNPSHFDLERISIIQKHIRIFSILPWISFVAICNSTAFYQSKEDSDIDLFIQCDPKRIMLVRIFLNLALRFSGILRSSGDEKKKVCLSFFHARENLLPIALKTDDQVDDPYFCAWIRHLRVIYERKDEFSQFISRHTWAGDTSLVGQMRHLVLIGNSHKDFFLLSFFLDFLDGILFFLYTKIFRPIFSSPPRTPWGCLVERDVQKLHPDDIRWKERS